MSEGSYEKDGGSSEDHESFGSAKGSRSSGNSSLSPHNSMEGSPRMLQSTSQFQPQHSSSNPGVNLGKKTIRNYTPKESSNMLREFEDRRNNSVDYRAKNNSRSKPRLERKSSVERMIDDFHRSLPPPGVENRQQETNNKDSTINTDNASKKASKHGTMNSQISNWSAASSAASFDYQPALGGGLKKTKSSDLPSLDEEYSNDDDDEPDFERVPPEGAASVKGTSPTNFGPSPTNFVQRIEVKNRSPSPPKKSSSAQKSRKTQREELLPPPPPPPPPPHQESEDQDEFSNLRRLISEGRIAGLNEKPPSFIPPSPPSSPKKDEKSSSRRPSSAKPPAPSTPKTPKSSHSVERGPSKKNPAPKPPITSNVSTPSSEVKFVSSRAREPSLEDLTKMSNKKRNEVKRSSSNHGTRPSGKYL